LGKIKIGTAGTDLLLQTIVGASRRLMLDFPAIGLIRGVSVYMQCDPRLGLDSHIARPRDRWRKPTVPPGRKYGLVIATSLAPETAVAATGLIETINIE
jgi:hypothetical protein